MKHKNYIKQLKYRSVLKTRARKHSEYLFELLKKLYVAQLNGTSIRDIPGIEIFADRRAASGYSTS